MAETERREKSIRLFQAIGEIPEEYIASSEEYGRTSGGNGSISYFVKRAGLLAASLVIILVGVAGYQMIYGSRKANDFKSLENMPMTIRSMKEESGEELYYTNGASMEAAAENVELLLLESCSMEEIRDISPLGAYLPQRLPADYTISQAYIDGNTGGDNSLSVLMNKGELELLIALERSEAAPELGVGIPVIEYWEVTAEFLEENTSLLQDYGDAAKHKLTLGVHLIDDIYLYYNGNGAPQEIFDMLMSVEFVCQ